MGREKTKLQDEVILRLYRNGKLVETRRTGEESFLSKLLKILNSFLRGD